MRGLPLGSQTESIAEEEVLPKLENESGTPKARYAIH